MKPFSLNIAQAALAASLFLCCAEVPEELGNPNNGPYSSSSAGLHSQSSSSSSLRQSSSSGSEVSEIPSELLCAAAPETGAEGEALRKPTVTCGGIAVSASSWAGSPHAPDWDSPKEGSYSGIVAIASCGGASKMADCPGLLTVVPAKLACDAVPSTGVEGMPVTKPAVLCDGVAVPAESWQPASLSWSSPEEGVYSSIKATAKCGGASKTAACSGTLAVVPPSGVLACDAVPSAGAAGVAITPPAVKCDGAAVSAANVTWSSGAPAWGNPSAGVAGMAIIPPAVKCDGAAVSAANVTWSSGAPAWGNPSANTYSGVKATANCGGASKAASCGGTLTVSPNLLTCSWASKPASITQGSGLESYQRPTVSCSSGSPTNADYTPSVYAAFYEIGSIPVSVTASCGGVPQTAQCDALNVVAPSSSSNSVQSSSSIKQYCYWTSSGCYEIRDDKEFIECQSWGTFVSACPTTIKQYCDYGSGGCFEISVNDNGNCVMNYGTVVSACPNPPRPSSSSAAWASSSSAAFAVSSSSK